MSTEGAAFSAKQVGLLNAIEIIVNTKREDRAAS